MPGKAVVHRLRKGIAVRIGQIACDLHVELPAEEFFRLPAADVGNFVFGASQSLQHLLVESACDKF